MRYAIFSDIHGNLPAWEQVYADIQHLQADVLICLGDVVGYGPKPQEVLDGIRAATDHFVLGNHDAAAAGIIDPAIFNENAHAVVLWTRDALSEESLKFLHQVPLELETPDILFVHAEVPDPGRFGYIEEVSDAEASFAARSHFVTFVGHTHHPECFERLPYGAVQKTGDKDRKLDSKCRYIINVGSVGEPRNPGDIRARYVIYDDDTKQVYFRRIEFDANLYKAQLRSTTLKHTPYFIQVLDNQSSAVAEIQDMQVPAQAASGFTTTRQTLNIPAAGQALPRIKPSAASKQPPKKSGGALTFFILSTIAIAAGLIYWFYYHEARPTEQLDITETSRILEKDITPPQITPLPKPVFAIDSNQANTWKEFLPRRGRNRPRLTKNQPGQPRLLYFDGRDDFLHSKPVLKPGDDTFTYIALIKPIQFNGAKVICEQAGPGIGARASLQLLNDEFRFCGQDNDSPPLGKLSIRKWQLLVMVLNGKPVDNLIAIHNNSPSIITTIDMTKQNVGNLGFRVGHRTIKSAEFFRGQIGVVEVYDTALSTEQLGNRLMELQEKWGLNFEPQIPEMKAIE